MADIAELVCCGSIPEHIIDRESLSTGCGGYVCKSCIQNDSINCRKCKKMHNVSKEPVGDSVLKKLEKNGDQYETLLHGKNEFKNILKSLDENFLKKFFDNKCERVICDIDVYIDSLKTDLDNIRTLWINQIEDLKQNVDIKDDDLEKIRVKYKNIRITNYEEFPEQIKKIQEEINMLEKKLPKVEFYSLFDLKEEDIGKLEIKEKVINSLIPNGPRAIRNEKKIEIFNYHENEKVRNKCD